LAKVVNEPVLYTPTEVASIEALKTVPIEAVKPTAEVIPVAEVVKAPPVEMAKMEAPVLPKTGSNLPLYACLGMFSLGAAVVMTKRSA
jgi:hypothetical protein